MVRIGIVGTNFISEWFMAGARRTAGRVEPVAVSLLYAFTFEIVHGRQVVERR